MHHIANRPLITFLLLAYEQERFVEEAIEGAFSQTYSPLEIILSDDCSTDGTFAIMLHKAAEYAGPHKVIVRRNQHNLGLIGHINVLMEEVEGELIVVAAGDDVSLPYRVQRIFSEFVASGGEAVSIFSNAVMIDEAGNQRGLLRRRPANAKRLTVRWFVSTLSSGVHGCTHAWHRKVFDLFGPMNDNTAFEDVVIPFRSALLGQVRYVDEPLVLYREHRDRLFDVNGRPIVSSFRTRTAQSIEPHIQICRGRLSDLDRLLVLQSERREELLGLQQATRQLLLDAEREKIMISGSLTEKIRTLGQALLNGTPWPRIARWALIQWLPSLYALRLTLYYWVRDSNLGRTFFAAGKPAVCKRRDGERGTQSP